MSQLNSGSCRCGTVKVKVTLPQPLCNYAPRRCTCEFCERHDGCYLSDPAGRLHITTTAALEEVKQGSGSASMNFCAVCNDLICATFHADSGLIGNIRSGLLKDASALHEEVNIAPQTLSATEKITRWQTLWMQVKTTVTQ